MDKLKLFVIWLEGYMQACGPVLSEEQTSVVKDKLNDLFEHAAEPILLNLQNEFMVNSLYNLPNDPDGPVIMRC